MTAMTPQDYLEIAYRRRWWIIVPIVLSLSAAAVQAKVSTKWYRSNTLILVEPQKVPQEYVRATVTGSVEDRLTTIRQQILSRSLLQRIIDEFKLYQDQAGKAPTEQIFNSMRKRITIDTIRSRTTAAFIISFVGRDPTTTMNVTNKLASIFIEENLKIREQLVEGTADFLNVELQRLREKLEEQERALSQYKQRYMGVLPSQLDSNLRTLDRLQLQLQSLATSIRDAEDRKMLLDRLTAPGGTELEPAALGLLLRDPRIGQLQTLERRLMELQAEYTESYPDIMITKQRIAQLEAELRSDDTLSSASDVPVVQGSAPTSSQRPISIEQEIARMKEQQQDILNQITLYEKRIEDTPKRELELTTLTRDYGSTQHAYGTLLSKVGNAKISENLEKRQKGERFRIIDPANLPDTPFKPNILKLLLFGLMLGAGVGGALTFMLENLDTSIKKSNELEEQFGFPVLGVIPEAEILRKVGSVSRSITSPRQPARLGGQP